jgi:hypothetical protein
LFPNCNGIAVLCDDVGFSIRLLPGLRREAVALLKLGCTCTLTSEPISRTNALLDDIPKLDSGKPGEIPLLAKLTSP